MIDTSQILLENIFIAMSDRTFSKDEAARIVGGRVKLMNLIERGEIEVTKSSSTQNGKWYCNATQVLKHCKNFRQ